jgi:hypothetical protein
MAGYQTDTVQCFPLIHVPPLLLCRAVTQKLWATSFFIFCATCLWDAVGHFLGHAAQSRHAGITGLCGPLSVDGAWFDPNYVK